MPNLLLYVRSLRDDYLDAVDGMKNLLVQRTKISNLTFIGELENNGKVFKPKMDHLVCYLPGTLALGVAHGLPNWHMDFAKALLYTCYQVIYICFYFQIFFF